MTISIRHVLWRGCLGGGLLFTVFWAQALTTVTVKVTIVAPPSCVINDNRPIEVDFGNEVAISRLDGNSYRQPVKYTLVCKGLTANAMKMQIQGTGAGFDSAVLATNKADLGIMLLNDDKKLAVNSWQNFTYPTTPTLQAVPVKKAGAKLTAGGFTAGASMRVDYQ